MHHTEIEENKTKLLTEVMDSMHGLVSDWSKRWRGRAYFQETGMARLMSIAGYMTGLSHAGQAEFAEQLAQDFWRNMDHLCLTERTIEFEGLDIPARKVILFDDRSLHSFGFTALSPVPAKDFNQIYNLNLESYKADPALQEMYGDQEYIFAKKARQKTIEDLKIIEKTGSDIYPSELTEKYWINGKEKFAYYSNRWHGGLIYHGPGSGETFSVVVGSGKTLWSLHS